MVPLEEHREILRLFLLRPRHGAAAAHHLRDDHAAGALSCCSASAIRNKIRRNLLPALKCSSAQMQPPNTVEAGAWQNATATELSVSGMTCQNCARHVTEAIQGVSGVHSATVSLENKNVAVRWNPGAMANVPALIKAVKNAGYEAKVVQADACDASC